MAPALVCIVMISVIFMREPMMPERTKAAALVVCVISSAALGGMML